MKFEIVGEIEQIEIIASGGSVKARARLQRVHGNGDWRKVIGVATVRLSSGKLRKVELHWYEAHGIGRRDFKIKTFVV